MRATTRRLAGPVVLAVMLLALTACAGIGDAASSATPPASSSPEVTPSGDASASAEPGAEEESPAPVDPAALVIPPCEALFPLEEVRARFAASSEAFPVDRPVADYLPGPLAADTARSAEQAQACLWGIPNSDGGFFFVVAELAAQARDDLVAGLRSAPFIESTIDGALAFTRDEQTDVGGQATCYLFLEDAWVAAFGALSVAGATEFAGIALANVRTANPDLG